jgi:hypothetical protein
MGRVRFRSGSYTVEVTGEVSGTGEVTVERTGEVKRRQYLSGKHPTKSLNIHTKPHKKPKPFNLFLKNEGAPG